MAKRPEAPSPAGHGAMPRDRRPDFDFFTDAPAFSHRPPARAEGVMPSVAVPGARMRADEPTDPPVDARTLDAAALSDGLAAMARLPGAREAAMAAAQAAGQAGPDEISDAEALRRQQAAHLKASLQARANHPGSGDYSPP